MTSRGLSAGGDAAAGAVPAMTTILGDDGAEGRNIPDLMTQRLRIVALQRVLAMPAGAGLTFQHAVGLVVEGALGLGVSVLAAGFVVGRLS